MSDATASGGLAAALHTDGPAAGRAAELDLFGRFVGSWELTWTGVDGDGRPVEALGELHVGWVLGGRAVQDTWIVPGPGRPGHGEGPLGFHGTTIRFHDPALGAWRSTWVEPVNGRVRRFVGTPRPWGIELVSDEDSPRLRWTFSAITATRFTWDAYESDDPDGDWEHRERVEGRRVAP